MTLMKSILLGSAAGIIAVASAQAADLPTRKAAPVEYVRVCNVGGITGWTLPGSDTCLKVSGYITAQFVGGNTNTQYNWGSVGDLLHRRARVAAASGAPITARAGSAARRALSAALTGIRSTTAATRPLSAFCLPPARHQQNTNFYRNNTGWSIRANLALDVASNTA